MFTWCSALVEPLNTIILFDWDNTLFSTSAVTQESHTLQEMEALSSCVEAVLRVSRRLGHTAVVTNSLEGWVAMSSSQYLPRSWNLLHGTEVVSARSQYEHMAPGNTAAWKHIAFRKILEANAWRSRSGINLIVIGDSMDEMAAASSVSKMSQTPVTLKTVKFKDNPSVNDVIQQLSELAGALESLVEVEGDASLYMCEQAGGFQLVRNIDSFFRPSPSFDRVPSYFIRA